MLYLVTPRTQATHGRYLKRVEEELRNLVSGEAQWVLRPEWAKGWAYKDEFDGAWKHDESDIQSWLESGWPGAATDVGSYRHAASLANTLDPHGVFSSKFHRTLLP